MNQLVHLCCLVLFITSCNSNSTKLNCEKISGLDKILNARQIIILGELHGTNEAPHYIYQMTCKALSKGHTVSVALEIPQDHQNELDKYLNSQGTKSDKKDFLSNAFWSDDYQDGRRSKAMFNLIENIKILKHQGYPINLYYMDGYSSGGREQTMANRIFEIKSQNQEQIILALVGNFHNTIVEGSEKMGALILEKYGRDQVISLNQDFVQGTAWIDIAGEEAGPIQLNGNGSSSIGIYIDKAPWEYHGTFEMHKITHSSPAKELLKSL